MKSNENLVSICILTYNRPQGLQRTLECITGQTYQNLEILIGDNCSTTLKTRKIAEKYLKVDNRVKYFCHNKNLGAVNNFKYLLNQVSGEYLMFASDDDEWYPEYIEKCLSQMISDSSIYCSSSKAIIVSDVILKNDARSKNISVNPKGFEISPYWQDDEDYCNYGLSPLKRVKKYILSCGVNIPTFGIYRTKTFKEHYFNPSHNPYKFGVDRFFVARVNLHGSIYQVPEYLFVYHHGLGDSCTNPLRQYGDEIPRWEYYGLRINPLLTAYLNMIIDSLSWPVSIPDHIRIIGYYLARMAKAKIMRYTMKTPFVGTPLYDYKPPVYPKRKDI